jgi:L-ascorbate metabolism protein UlaG (beta-lactamase superfamily)
MRKFSIFFVWILIVILCGFTKQERSLKVTYIANCGFLYQGNKSKVLIDPFGTEFGCFIYLPSDISKKDIVKGNRTDRCFEVVSNSDYTEYGKTENYGYVIHFKKKIVFHQGDGCLKINIKALKNIDYPINIVHLGYFDWDSISLRFIKKDLEAETVFFMHRTKPAKEIESEQLKGVKPQITFSVRS